MSTRDLLLSLIGAALLGGCYYDTSEELYGPSCDLTAVKYSTTIKPIIDANCAGSSCHGVGGSQGELVTYEQLQATVADGVLRDAVVISRRMPDGGALSECEVDQIDLWLSNGAPND